MMQEMIDLLMTNHDFKDRSERSEAVRLFDLGAFPVLNIDTALQHIGNKKDLVKLFELMITENLIKESDNLHKAFIASDWKIIQEVSHKIKGAAVYVGTVRLQMACQYLEQYLKAGHKDWAEPLYYQLDSVIRETKKQMMDYCSNN